ncbi:hypothetical protein MRX96_010902 [Rhipicephalus microplus]
MSASTPATQATESTDNTTPVASASGGESISPVSENFQLLAKVDKNALKMEPKLVLPLQQDVAPIVYVFKVLSRCFNPEDADAERNKKNACLLNRKLMATLKRWPCVRILNTKALGHFAATS